jgi:hypothetical protein
MTDSTYLYKFYTDLKDDKIDIILKRYLIIGESNNKWLILDYSSNGSKRWVSKNNEPFAFTTIKYALKHFIKSESNIDIIEDKIKKAEEKFNTSVQNEFRINVL